MHIFLPYFICFCSYKIHNTQSTALKTCRIHGVFKKHSNVLWNVTAALPLFRLNRSLMHFENTFKAKLETRRKMLPFSSLFILITQKKKSPKGVLLYLQLPKVERIDGFHTAFNDCVQPPLWDMTNDETFSTFHKPAWDRYGFHSISNKEKVVKNRQEVKQHKGLGYDCIVPLLFFSLSLFNVASSLYVFPCQVTTVASWRTICCLSGALNESCCLLLRWTHYLNTTNLL